MILYCVREITSSCGGFTFEPGKHYDMSVINNGRDLMVRGTRYTITNISSPNGRRFLPKDPYVRMIQDRLRGLVL